MLNIMVFNIVNPEVVNTIWDVKSILNVVSGLNLQKCFSYKIFSFSTFAVSYVQSAFMHYLSKHLYLIPLIYF